MAETLVGSLQNIFAQQRAVGMEHHDAGIVADGAHIIHVVRQALKLRHDAAQQNGARRWPPLESGFDGKRIGIGVGNRAVARNARRDACRRGDIGAPAQGLDSLVGVTEPLFEAHHRFAVGGEAEMSGFDDPGMNRPYGDLMQPFAFGGQESVRRVRPRRILFQAWRR